MLHAHGLHGLRCRMFNEMPKLGFRTILILNRFHRAPIDTPEFLIFLKSLISTRKRVFFRILK